ncbi:MAG: MBL fold metallo-hydrolase [SAR324 cluster bacterium]|nr:MBL fold metallo-hydrolase [SAR324 cluster bacterium]
MKSKVIYKEQGHQWVILGRDVERTNTVIDTNEYIIINNGNAMLLDPGGNEIFPQVLAELTRYLNIEEITTIVGSHQDPDIMSSLAMWIDLCPNVDVYCSWLWTGFISHFGMGTKLDLLPIPDQGMEIPIGKSGASVFAIPAHYCHSSGNFSFFDPIAEILFSGDVGTALLPSMEAPLFVEDFNTHIQYMEGFHQRWMPSSSALRGWVRRVKELNPSMICPQHGSIFRGDDVNRLLNWLETLDVGKIKQDANNAELTQSIAMRRKKKEE